MAIGLSPGLADFFIVILPFAAHSVQPHGLADLFDNFLGLGKGLF
jgi:hypothetical protein